MCFTAGQFRTFHRYSICGTDKSKWPNGRIARLKHHAVRQKKVQFLSPTYHPFVNRTRFFGCTAAYALPVALLFLWHFAVARDSQSHSLSCRS